MIIISLIVVATIEDKERRKNNIASHPRNRKPYGRIKHYNLALKAA